MPGYLLKILPVTFIFLFLSNCTGDNARISSGVKSFHREWPANTLFMNSTSRSMMTTDTGITLENQILIEDDAPACGYSSKEGSVEVLKKGVLIKKILILNEIPAGPAWIAMLVYPDFPPQPNNGRHLLFTVNGHKIKYEVRHFWTDVPVPASFLHRGENIITVHTFEPDTRFKTWVALDENYRFGSVDRLHHPNRSARSTDGGKTWDFDHLGEKGIVDGEYPIRLKISNYHPSGWLLSPVIDMAANSDEDGIKQPVIIEKAKIKLQGQSPGKTHLEVQARSGPVPFTDAGDWEGWQLCKNGKIAKTLLKNRFLQFKVIFRTSSPETSPLLKSVYLDTRYKTENKDLLNGIEVASLINHPLINSSFEFEYENPLHPKLKALRAKYKLDEVIKGAGSEFEKMLKLKTWVAGQWHWHLLKPDAPPVKWDAGEILKTNGGYCLHYSIVFMQVLQSFGFKARVINANYAVWGGHEMTEVWSSQFGKWIVLDANFDTYFADKKTGIPLNTLELHNIFLETYYPGEVIDRNDWSREDLVKRVQAKGAPKSVVCITGGGANGGTISNYSWDRPVVELYPYCGGYGLLSTGYFRLLPRSNFLSKPYPVPLNHGRTHWGWTGYYNWYDKQTPRAPEYNLFTNRPNDLYPNLNEVYFSAMVNAPGKLFVSLATNSPCFDHYRVNANGNVTALKDDHYSLDLVPGRNDLKIQVIDVMGNHGPVSELSVIYNPAKE